MTRPLTPPFFPFSRDFLARARARTVLAESIITEFAREIVVVVAAARAATIGGYNGTPVARGNLHSCLPSTVQCLFLFTSRPLLEESPERDGRIKFEYPFSGRGVDICLFGRCRIGK